MKLVLLLSVGLALASAPVAANAQTVRQQGAHVHGTTTVDVGLDGTVLQVVLDAPAINMLGFEHPPHDEQQSKQVADVLAAMRDPAPWLIPADAAVCVLTHSSVQARGLDATAPMQGHADIDARYDYRCKQPDKLDHVDIHLADRYPATHRLVVNIVLPQKQDRRELGQGEYRVMLAP
jgi:Protein of unknown function (DUF2796)